VAVPSKLGELVALSDSVLDSVQSIVVHALSQLPSDAMPIAVLFDWINFHEHRRAIEFGLEIAEIACHSLHLNWRDEDDLIESLIEFLLAHDWPKKVLGQVRKRHTDAIEAFLNLLNESVQPRNVARIGRLLLNEELLARLSPILRKSSNWQALDSRLSQLDPALFSHLEQSAPADEKVIWPFKPLAVDAVSSSIDIDTSFIEEAIPCLVFCSNQAVRANVVAAIKRILPTPDPDVANYVRTRIIDPSLTLPSILDESSFTFLLLSLVPEGLQQPETFREFAPLLLDLTTMVPFGASDLQPDIDSCVQTLDDDDPMIKIFLHVVKNLLAFDDSLIPQVSNDTLRRFFGCT
jgi:hypothetical protein